MSQSNSESALIKEATVIIMPVMNLSFDKSFTTEFIKAAYMMGNTEEEIVGMLHELDSIKIAKDERGTDA